MAITTACVSIFELLSSPELFSARHHAISASIEKSQNKSSDRTSCPSQIISGDIAIKNPAQKAVPGVVMRRSQTQLANTAAVEMKIMRILSPTSGSRFARSPRATTAAKIGGYWVCGGSSGSQISV